MALNLAVSATEVSNVKVAVRVRPFNQREKDKKSRCIVTMRQQQTVLVHPYTEQVQSFMFDHSFWSFDNVAHNCMGQLQIFDCIGQPMVDKCLQGFNCTIMAYGQTGSGKSHTVIGSLSESSDEQGLILRILQQLFVRIRPESSSSSKTYHVAVSFLEIYAEKVKDLLDPQNTAKLSVREHTTFGPYVESLTMWPIQSAHDAYQCLLEGAKHRITAPTKMNQNSSRSHAIFTIYVTQTHTLTQDKTLSKIHLVDLAGSERVKDSGVTGINLKEAANINKSLTTLGRVIKALTTKPNSSASSSSSSSSSSSLQHGNGSRSTVSNAYPPLSTPSSKSLTQAMSLSPRASHGPLLSPKNHALESPRNHIPFRDSVLTLLLKDSLGGNSQTCMMANISPADINYEESLSTLQYAARAKNIVNKACVWTEMRSQALDTLADFLRHFNRPWNWHVEVKPPSTMSTLLQEQKHASVQEIDHISNTFQAYLQAKKTRAEKLRDDLQHVNTPSDSKEQISTSMDPTQNQNVHTFQTYLLNQSPHPALEDDLLIPMDQPSVIAGTSLSPPWPVNFFIETNGQVWIETTSTTSTTSATSTTSTSPIYINQQILQRKILLTHGAILQFGDTIWKFQQKSPSKLDI